MPFLTLGLPLGLMYGVASAVNSDVTTLPNGAELSVQIDNPTNNEENAVASNADGSAGGTTTVAIDGEASVGQGVPNIHVTFVMDVSGSTELSCGGGTGLTILGCEQVAVNNVIGDENFSSVKDVGVSVFATSGAFADMSSEAGQQELTSSTTDAATVVNSTFAQDLVNGGVNLFTLKTVGFRTNFTQGLIAANNSLTASTADTLRVIFLSDGTDNESTLSDFNAAIAALPAQTQIDSFAIGGGAACGDASSVSLQRMANLTGGICTPVPDPSTLPALLPDLLYTSLDSVQVKVDGSDVATSTSTALPADGPVTATYAASDDLGVGTYAITATAEGSDNAGGDSVTAEVTKEVLQLIASPYTETNELSEDNSHTVYGQILGGAGPDRDIDFVVTGTNAGPSGSVLATPGGGAASFTYTVDGNECSSLGPDTITVSTTIAGGTQSIALSKEWVDTIAPTASCDPTNNPAGKNEPSAPGNGGQGQNQDGFYQLNAEDNLTGDSCDPLAIYLTDTGSGTVFGPFAVGTVIKYTEDPDATPEQKKMGGKGADYVTWHIIGNGDAAVTAVDQSGNTSEPVSCLVPPPPK